MTPPSSTTSDGNSQQIAEEQGRDSLWTHNSVPLRTQQAIPPLLTTHGSSSKGKRPAIRARSLSQSTIDVRSIHQDLENEAFKVVIDRADSSATSMRNHRISLPTLEVPIPHYRLGTPRFSARGTAFLHSSVYTRSSTNEDGRSSMFVSGDFDRLFPVPSTIEPRSVLSRRHSHTSPQPFALNTNSSHEDTTNPVFAVPVVHRQRREPISPTVYDEIAANPNNPAAVRYSTLTGEIVAGTPARIVAQVTSENFLDYELLSDFFLTVRAYLSTQDLLSYLVARFEWAINRFDDNGRVIRVRAFAALRHWILNYFAYDFVLDRDLRVQFCNRLNELTRIVRGRISYGNSDMKLITDLKKCWNGRCLLYWDQPEAVDGNQHDIDIYPGGLSGSRNSQTSNSRTDAELMRAGQALRYGNPAADPDDMYETARYATHGHSHERQASTTTTRSLPTSPISEQSIQAMSCSIPAKGFKNMITHASRPPGNRQNPHDGHRLCPAASSATAHERGKQSREGHKRSGSFSDAARDHRASLSSVRNGVLADQAYTSPQPGSIIRGNIIQPAHPYVKICAPTTPSIEFPSVSFSSHDNDVDIYENKKLGPPATPGVKNFLGSIRRALSRKYSGSSGSPNLGVNGISAPSLPAGKSSNFVMNLTYQIGSNGHIDTSSTRIDILAVNVAEAFHRAFNQASQEDLQNLRDINLALGNEREQPSQKESDPLSRQAMLGSSNRPTNFRRMHSEVTNGSQSILIVDDTGPDIPYIPVLHSDISRGEEYRSHGPNSYLETQSVAPVSTNPSSVNVPGSLRLHNGAEGKLIGASQFQSKEAKEEPKRQLYLTANAPILDFKPDHQSFSALNRGHSFKTSKSGSSSLRRYASFQSTFTKSVPGKNSDRNNASESHTFLMQGSNDNPPARMLRRRPGGDLRANQNVHDLQSLPRSRSAGSITTYTDSTRGSTLAKTSKRRVRSNASRMSSEGNQADLMGSIVLSNKKSPSLVHTHSSQPAIRRPSFEAAVAEFARIPDDEEGGIEATLLKLEGRYQKSPAEPSHEFIRDIPEKPYSQEEKNEHEQQEIEYENPQDESIRQTYIKQNRENTTPPDQDILPKQKARESPNSDHHEFQVSSMRLSQEGRSVKQIRRNLTDTTPSIHYAESEESYNSTPLLEREPRGRSVESYPKSKSQTVSIPRPLFSPKRLSADDRLHENNSVKRLRHGSSVPTVTTDSFLLDEDEFLSDLSSELSEDQATEEEDQHPGHRETLISNIAHHPPSPPMTVENALSINSQASHAREQRRPPTPDPSPTSQHAHPDLSEGSPRDIEHLSQTSLHLPFVLGYDSEILAQQFTVIERDGLNEIDWRDLVDMRWQDSSPQLVNWVDYLRTHQARGIDLVTARFNLMVKWALSEIVLTRNLEERVLTIMKYIHIAQQAKKVHNYATLLQLTIALTSVDCTRLSKTWEMVPASERKILEELETLVTPRRNFHNLRMEMEKANAAEGCIPVIGTFHPSPPF